MDSLLAKANLSYVSAVFVSRFEENHWIFTGFRRVLGSSHTSNDAKRPMAVVQLAQGKAQPQESDSGAS